MLHGDEEVAASRRKQLKRQNDFIKENYKRTTITIKNDIYSELERLGAFENCKVNDYIYSLIAADLERRKAEQ